VDNIVGRVWREVALPPGLDGYVQVVRLEDGRLVALMLTSSAMSPHSRVIVRRNLLTRVLRTFGDLPELPEPPESPIQAALRDPEPTAAEHELDSGGPDPTPVRR